MSKHRRRSWTAYGMPQIVAQLFSEEGLPPVANDAGADGGLGNMPGADHTSFPLESPTLYWMQKSAIDVAVGLTANGVPSHTIAELLRSSNIADVGVMCFEKSIGTLRWDLAPGGDVPWDAVGWSLISGLPVDRLGERPMQVSFMSRMTDHQHLLRAVDARIGAERHRHKPLTIVRTWLLDSDARLIEEAVQDDVFAALLTSVLLTAGQPRITSQKVLGPEQGVVVPRADHGVAKRTRPEVVLIDLLRRPPDDAPGARAKGKIKEYDHRWWVRGHYKMQPYGPQGALRKTIYVFPHTAGPEDKPLLKQPRVNLIRTDPPRPAPGEEWREDGPTQT